MPVGFRILPRHGLCVVTFSGLVGIDETRDSVGECARHPDFRPGMRHIFDLTHVTGVERDYPAYLALQAKALENLGPSPFESLLVYLAPTRPAQEMAELIRKSWEGLDWAIVRIVSDEMQALELLGVRAQSLGELTETES
jgi:hypothetical protein